MMRFFCLIFSIFSLFLLFVSAVSAHQGPPFVFINNIYTLTNPIYNSLSSNAQFPIGADIASPSAYLVNEKLTFDVDEDFFPNPYQYQTDPNTGAVTASDDKMKVIYKWVFGNGEEKIGKKVEYAYKKSGTYIVEIQAQYPTKDKEFNTALTIQINILPHKNYVIPQAKVSLNGKVFNPEDIGIIKFKPQALIQFDGSKSSGKIKKYQWDFGDDSNATGKQVYHAYNDSEYYALFPVLRVTDENNIASDISLYLDTEAGDSIPDIQAPVHLKILNFLSVLKYKISSVFSR